MKHLISLVLCVIIVISLVAGCSSDNNQKSNSEICYNCGEYYVSNSNFCPMCGADLESHRIDNDDNTDHNINIDYSNFGFENLYNMTEWIEIERCVFNDSENPYIICDGSNMPIQLHVQIALEEMSIQKKISTIMVFLINAENIIIHNKINSLFIDLGTFSHYNKINLRD